ncbi:MAG: DUF167 domain-containing protein [Puniceicoccales bacterium]|jgi:uncharacterized protein YggU (UPF0235/DUF167 family)|nr:DUF167 domain-containing protein [Puniceicoccales bacterium]
MRILLRILACKDFIVFLPWRRFVVCYLTISVTAQSKRTAIGPSGMCPLRLWVRSPARGGRANDEVLLVLSKRLKLPRKFLSIVQGESAKLKRIAVSGMDEEEVKARLAEADGLCDHGKNI